MPDKHDLIQRLQRSNYITSPDVKEAFEKIPREFFVPGSMKGQAYVDSPLSIGSGQTISAPHMIAIMVEALDLKPGQEVLEIGTGSGYHAAIVSQLIKDSGHIYTIERHKSLADKAKHNLAKAGIENVTVEFGDGSKGLSKYEPYDRIYVTCAAPSAPPPLLDQLKDPGKLLIPIGKMYCELVKFEKKQGIITSENLGGCAFVPLIGLYGH